jgi:competence protein ComEC
VTGTVSAEPDVRDTGANYQITVDTLQVGARTRTISGGLYLHTSSAVHLDYGDRISLSGRLAGPGTSGFADSLARQGIYSEMHFPRLVNLGPSSSVSWFSSAVLRLRQHLEAGIDAWLPEPEAALLIAITLGARSSELGDLAPVLVTTGLIHLIAISGIKVALVAGMIQQAIRSFAGRLFSFLGATGALWLYVLLTGFTPSGVRSAGMWTLVFVASALGRQTVALLSLLAVAGVMVGLDPRLPWDTGFQLSAVGTLSIVAFVAPLDGVLRETPLRALKSRLPGPLSVLALALSPFLTALTVTLAAQLGTIPIAIIGFHQLSWLGPVANTIVLPSLPLLIILGFLLGALSGVGVVAALLASLGYALLRAAVAVASLLGGGGALPVAVLNPALAVTFYVMLFALALLVLWRAGWAPRSPFGDVRLELLVASVVALLLLTVTLVAARGTSSTRLTWLGTGNALLLQSNGTTALIDGSNQTFALKERLGSLLPFDTHAIDLIVVTDPRSSNVSGLEAVLQHYRIGEVLDVGVEYPTTTYARWRADLRAAHVPVYALRTGASVALGAARLTVLGPDALYPKPQDSAGILRLALPRRAFVLAAAADVREQHEAVFRGVRLNADTLVLGVRQDNSFVRAVGARTVISAGALPAVIIPLYP